MSYRIGFDPKRPLIASTDIVAGETTIKVGETVDIAKLGITEQIAYDWWRSGMVNHLHSPEGAETAPETPEALPESAPAVIEAAPLKQPVPEAPEPELVAEAAEAEALAASDEEHEPELDATTGKPTGKTKPSPKSKSRR